MKENYIMKLTLLEQKSQKLEEELKGIGQQINELALLKEDIKKIKESKEDEMLSGLGKGIFIKTKMLEREFVVNVGSNILLKKSPAQVLELIEEQVKQLSEMKTKVVDEIEETNINLERLVEKAKKEAMEIQKEREKETNKKEQGKKKGKKKSR